MSQTDKSWVPWALGAGALFFINQAGNSSGRTANPIVPVVDAAVFVDRQKPNLPSTFGQTPSGASMEVQGASAPKTFRCVSVKTTNQIFCPSCEVSKASVHQLHERGWKKSLVDFVVDESFPAYPVTVVYGYDGKEVYRRSGAATAGQLAELYSQLSPSELKDRIRSWQGRIVNVIPSTWQGYANHICDPTQHKGLHYSHWQLQGMTLSELQKLHSAQHAGTKWEGDK